MKNKRKDKVDEIKKNLDPNVKTIYKGNNNNNQQGNNNNGDMKEGNVEKINENEWRCPGENLSSNGERESNFNEILNDNKCYDNDND